MTKLDPEFRGGRVQGELVDAGLLYVCCRRCGRRLHPDRKRRFQNRMAGLCYVCCPLFAQWPNWDVITFVQAGTGDDIHKHT